MVTAQVETAPACTQRRLTSELMDTEETRAVHPADPATATPLATALLEAPVVRTPLMVTAQVETAPACTQRRLTSELMDTEETRAAHPADPATATPLATAPLEAPVVTTPLMVTAQVETAPACTQRRLTSELMDTEETRAAHPADPATATLLATAPLEAPVVTTPLMVTAQVGTAPACTQRDTIDLLKVLLTESLRENNKTLRYMEKTQNNLQMRIDEMKATIDGIELQLTAICMKYCFTLHKLADMRRTGVGKPRPLLDQEKLDLFRGHDSIIVAKKFDRLVADLERKMRAALRCLKEMLKGLD
ncbi:hypothetical protein DPMN_193948 [Dreissena polymorpha]|uniref:Uncharacterized protein n=1 Tax=Dreissena polymorpha TaxID=45954 RepID=A0A9D3Y4I2_DREPO|nr:hypothetical protein DPMN_193948 [Dreissena polymorpha]